MDGPRFVSPPKSKKRVAALGAYMQALCDLFVFAMAPCSRQDLGSTFNCVIPKDHEPQAIYMATKMLQLDLNPPL